MASQYPVIGAWYQDLIEDQIFEVVAVDEQFSTVEIQYLGGEVSEFDLESWSQLALNTAEAPEDAGAAYELSQDDDWYGDSSFIPDQWNNPLVSIEPEAFPTIEDF